MAVLSFRLTWRTTLLLIYLVANLKSLPFAWHVRVLYHFVTNVSRKTVPAKSVSLNNTSKNDPPASHRRILTHPLFAPAQITTHSPLLETDYNLHKSNSTYLSDLDVSRTKLVTRLFSPGFRKVNVQLEKEGHRGRMVVALGAVHVTFRREIGIYERVAVRSRVLSWDEKWVVVVSYFVRTKRARGKGTKNGEEEELCAVGLSKYVVKKGRFTVRPERVFRMAGWLPEKPSSDQQLGGSKESNGETLSSSSADAGGKGSSVGEQDANGGLTAARIPELAEKVVLDEDAAAAASGTADVLSTSVSGKIIWDADAWSWEEIEEERLRGLELARGWLALDGELSEEFEKN